MSLVCSDAVVERRALPATTLFSEEHTRNHATPAFRRQVCCTSVTSHSEHNSKVSLAVPRAPCIGTYTTNAGASKSETASLHHPCCSRVACPSTCLPRTSQRQETPSLHKHRGFPVKRTMTSYTAHAHAPKTHPKVPTSLGAAYCNADVEKKEWSVKEILPCHAGACTLNWLRSPPTTTRNKN